MSDGQQHVLEVDDLRVHFQTPEGTLPAVDGISYGLEHGRTLGVVGESGSGKTTFARPFEDREHGSLPRYRGR
jgi:peptide/nickel transport system ATP-binding protein